MSAGRPLVLVSRPATSRRSTRRPRLLALQLDLRFETRGFGVVGLEGRLEPVVGRGIDVAAALARAIDGVAQRLGRLVGELAGAERFESGLAVVERILRGLAGAVELLLQSVE